MKISDFQKRIIQRLRDGDVIYFLNGLNARFFLGSNGVTINYNTVFRLEKLKLIELLPDGKYLLTELGNEINLSE